MTDCCRTYKDLAFWDLFSWSPLSMKPLSLKKKKKKNHFVHLETAICRSEVLSISLNKM